jgi:hypothetical protein
MARVGVGTIVGVDFDNTIINYNNVIRSVAIERGYLPPDGPTDKRSIRDFIRERPGGDGDIDWQRVQGAVYGPRINEAILIEGVVSFFRRCQAAKAKVHVISHKTEFSWYDPTRTNLRMAALQWLQDHDGFTPAGLGLNRDAIWFGATRREKLDHIRRLHCQVFIDDLIEVFAEPEFPPDVDAILFDTTGTKTYGRCLTYQSWVQIEEHLFDDDNR